MMQHSIIRENYSKYWESAPRKHKYAIPSSIYLKNDPSTLFTSSGMQQLVSFLKGKPHPIGKRLYNIQPCFRSQDINLVGDSKHTTFFEMMGNWSLGDYFKDEQLEWCLKYFTEILGLSKDRLYITVFEGSNNVKKDNESQEIWKKLGFKDEKIFFYGVDHNWWSRYGDPYHMPNGEIGGPDTEVFFDFGEELKFHEKSKYQNEKCHPNCECGRFLEIGNSVFIEYIKKDNKLIELPQKNVDYGGGLERISAAVNNSSDMFKTDLYIPTINEIEKITNQKYENQKNKLLMQIICDHIKASVFLIINGVTPSNKEQGYILRRLLRRSVVKMHQLKPDANCSFENIIDNGILKTYDGFQNINRSKQKNTINNIVDEEVHKFSKTLEKGLKEINKQENINGITAFNIYQSYGFPLEITMELLKEKGKYVDFERFREDFQNELTKHQDISRKSAEKKFKH